MSKAAGCTRANAINYLRGPSEKDTGSTNFTFWIGHQIEIAALATFIACGYNVNFQVDVIARDSNGKAIMASKADGVTTIVGVPTILSIKSAAYKMSGQQKGKWVRRGFAELPFTGVRNSQPSWYIQSQLEMYASGIKQSLVLVVAKDIVKVFENDEYLGKTGNGSLVFYSELINIDYEIIERALEVNSKQLSYAQSGQYGPAMYINSAYQYVELDKGHVVPSNIWGGVNKELTGKFNPCGGCNKRDACIGSN